MSRAGLQEIACFTLAIADIERVTTAYCQWLDFAVAERGQVSAALAQHWQTPSLAGSPLTLLEPAAGGRTRIRLIQQRPLPARAVLLAHGWNAMEILVRDPYQLAAELAGSPFRVLVAPRPLPFDADIHAMQVVGPAGELLYMTALPAHRSVLDLTATTRRVDQPFIAILGGRSVDQVLNYYERMTATPVIAPTPVIVQIINDTFNLPAAQAVPLGIVKLPRDYLIEVDELPPAASHYPPGTGQIPDVIAMVSFRCANLPELPIEWRQAPASLAGAPYDGRRAGLAVGCAGEWLELIEASD